MVSWIVSAFLMVERYAELFRRSIKVQNKLAAQGHVVKPAEGQSLLYMVVAERGRNFSRCCPSHHLTEGPKHVASISQTAPGGSRTLIKPIQPDPSKFIFKVSIRHKQMAAEDPKILAMPKGIELHQPAHSQLKWPNNWGRGTLMGAPSQTGGF
ncbi:hypothetical protein NPIL_43361 [Nephila pilipes]|uniref:Uncharacterized protein n=1 Tax=Nephila pilipes TaxID=299642 RepID=A0A8X6PP92_NEPPI|nr:hypothetical protein NPIL_43361 [Nephila pilipes]